MLQDMNFHVKKFSFCSITLNVYISKIRFSGNGEKTEFPGDENSSFSNEFSSPLQKEQAIYFIELVRENVDIFNASLQ